MTKIYSNRKYGCDRWQSWTHFKVLNVSNCNRNNEEGGIKMKADMLIKILKTNGFTYSGIYECILTKLGCKRLILIICSWNCNGLNVIICAFKTLKLRHSYHYTRHEGIWESEITAPPVLNHKTTWQWVVIFTPRPPYTCIHWTGRWVGPRASLDEIIPLPLSRIETAFLECPA
jgi:hypothetical protein